MNVKVLGILLLYLFAIMFLSGHDAAAEDVDGWNTEVAKPVSEPDGTEGFGVDLGIKKTGADSSGEATDVSETDQTAKKTLEGQEALDSGDTLAGTIDVDTYLNVRDGPWGKIISGLNHNAPIQIVAKEGDWFKIVNGDGFAYVHAYYVNAPGFPSHQGVEPPILGSNPYEHTGDPGASPTVDNGTFGAEPCSPMPDSVSSDFGPRDIGIGSTFHEGIDLPVPNGTRLNALGNGVVTNVGWTDGGGKCVYVRYDNGYTSFYCHLESVSVEEGQRVAIGQDIALSDNTGEWTTGAHLHMGIMDSSGTYVNPRDVPGLEFPPLVE
ncbi:MAG: hypothetical protein CVV42_17835 [Candidatus Riflebacteria bacterium HGW-Riflebacteria-2]|jgi:murein DD-endopeptidase MepM/ murein hydrolase activator NlpD|nr:MAG: hypothetical protein CVV42_17835 [Candidatus Riflebacteria bacterium HGW-Riflebacteria-2]